jgi:outer membrane protein OmpA-like peptidoglycan-associated protein
VGAAPIDAVDDTGTVANGSAGGVAVPNVLVNDTLNGQPATLANVTISQVSTTNPNVTIDPATGAVNVAPGTAAGTYTLVYQICEQLNPTNCDTATVTVTVGAAPIDAVDDTGTVANGTTGGVAVPNVLVNDTLNGAPATLANVTISQVSTTDPNVTIDPATGAVNVAPGTAAGTYTLVYQICEQLNPTNCDTATVTVTVGAAPIDAVDDTGMVANGSAGGVAVPNVLVNDTLNGAPATLANVTISQVSTTNPNVTIDPATGAVNVAPGTAAGTYTLVYQICEQLNPTNCDTATVTVTVGAAPIDAVDDTGTVANGSAGGVAVPNVLVNDTLNGQPATLATVTITQVSTTNPGVTIDPATGAVNVAPGTPAGTYTLVYQICEQLNPTNCDTATVTVTVGAAPINAVDDTGTVANGSAGGVAVPNVLVNDTLNGQPATLATVTITQVSTTNPGVTIDPATGAVNVAPGTPAGTYTLVYQICEQLNPTNCDTATVTVTVGAAPIDAVDDTGSVANGTTGGVAVPNVLFNDTLNGQPATLATVTITQVSTTNPGVTIDPATGAVNVAPGTPAGTYTLVYQICEQLNPTNCDTATVTVTVGAAPIDAVNDTGSVASGAAGGTAVPNVLVNDTLNGQPATLTTVTITQVSTTNPGVTIDPATGAVNVAPGTPAGTYTLVYQICEQLNPTNCDTATVTVTVAASTIVANNDTATTPQNTPVTIGVLGNDTLGGAAVTPADVTVTQVNPPANGTIVINPDGTITYTPNPGFSGNDTFTYQICENLNPTNCATATVTVTVAPNAVVANDDTATTPNATPVTINVLGNDTSSGAPLNPASVAIVTPSPNGTATVNPDGTITFTPNAGFSGTTTFTYQVCDTSTPTPVCDIATVTVTVQANVVNATDDTISVEPEVSTTIAVIRNDTATGSPLDPESLVLVTPATNGTVVCQSGACTYTSNPGFTGTDSFTYRVCDTSRPTPVCDTATVTVTVQGTTAVRLTKQANPRDVRAGDLVRYTVTMENIGDAAVVDGTLLDTPPAGFTYVDGSLAVADRDGAGRLVGTYPIRVDQIDIAIGGRATVTYLLRVGAGVRGGLHVNSAQLQDGGVSVSNVGTASVQLVADPTVDDSLILGTVFDDRDSDGWQDSAKISGLRVQGGFAPGAYVAGSTTVDRGAGAQPEADASAPLLHGLALGGIAGRQSEADPSAAHAVVVSQTLTALDFTDDFVLTTEQGVTVRMDAAGNTSVQRDAGDAANGLTAAVPTVQRKVAQVQGGYRVDYVIGNDGVDERGIPGVRIASVEGLIMETDQYGRYHVVGIDGGRFERGRNFILKVDPATLPPGSVFTTDNPLVRRITPGLPVRFDFGVKLPPGLVAPQRREVEMKIGTVLFVPDSAEVAPKHAAVIEAMAAKVREYGAGEVVITANGESQALAYDRAQAVRDALLAKLSAEEAAGVQVSLRADADDAGSLLVSIGESPVLGTVLFDTDRSEIKPQYSALLDKVADDIEALAANAKGDLIVGVVGKADRRGGDAYNVQLGLRRAKAVYDALAARLAPEVRARVRVETSEDPTAPVGLQSR